VSNPSLEGTELVKALNPIIQKIIETNQHVHSTSYTSRMTKRTYRDQDIPSL
jgi:hypothetical protein